MDAATRKVIEHIKKEIAEELNKANLTTKEIAYTLHCYETPIFILALNELEAEGKIQEKKIWEKI